MNQQINLYQPAVFIKAPVFAARQILLAAVLIIVILLLAYGFSWRRLQKLEGRRLELAARLENARQRNFDVQQHISARQDTLVLTGILEELRAAKDARLPLLTVLADLSPDQSSGFSEALRGLAREDLDGVWLRHIYLSEGGRTLVLKGSALQAEQVPVYMQRLSRQQSLAGIEFSTLVVTRSEERQGMYDFELSTALEKTP